MLQSKSRRGREKKSPLWSKAEIPRKWGQKAQERGRGLESPGACLGGEVEVPTRQGGLLQLQLPPEGFTSFSYKFVLPSPSFPPPSLPPHKQMW